MLHDRMFTVFVWTSYSADLQIIFSGINNISNSQIITCLIKSKVSNDIKKCII